MDPIEQLTQTMTSLGEGFTAFQSRYDQQLASERRQREELERKVNFQRLRPVGTNNDDPTHVVREVAAPLPMIEAKTGAPLPVLSHRMRLRDMPGERDVDIPVGSVGRMMRGLVLGGRAADAVQLADERKALGIVPDPSGGYTVGISLSNMWVDLLRAKMVLSAAGAVTLPMEARDVVIAKLTGDVTASWHGENAALTAQ